MNKTHEHYAIAFVSTRKLQEWIDLLKDCLIPDKRGRELGQLIAEMQTGQDKPVLMKTPKCLHIGVHVPMIFDPRKNLFHCPECGKERTS